ncbi:ABC transporter ATP-binding protein [Cellvibrio polysaccharolyticus]|uniref:ABC transporter ATP-binding protein n=1 Tax=Cellvibrio polysaccharolyticus TaxID=2082724 RepID=A0A928YT25_9GAMM|nr:ABC transporter ATP-binding protein [Cellvibrio polysaccharolyticus]MBE8716579.1 ABC transporter ATP-binding protein [Cellvibrio polysaccharolyticus]
MSLKNWPLLRCLALYREMPWRFTITAVLFAALNFSMAWQQWLLGRAIHDVERGVAVVQTASGALDYSVALTWMMILFAIAFGRGIIQYLAGLSSLIIGQDLLFILRERIFHQVQNLDLVYHREHGVGGMVTRTTRDADKLRDALMNFWRQIFETLLLVIATVGMLCWYNVWLGVIPLVITIAGVGIFVLQTNHLVTLDRATGAAYDTVNQNLTEGVAGVRVIKAFGLESLRIEDFTRQVAQFSAHARAALAYATSRIPVPQMVIAMGHVWVLGFGALLVGDGKLNIGELVASVMLANTLIIRVEGIGRVIQIFADARASAARIWELLDARPARQTGTAPLPAGALGVKLDNVSVQPQQHGKPVLQHCHLTIEPGEVVAVVGTTGSGKSTLMSLLPRLVDADQGKVAIGSTETGWQDVQTLNSEELRNRVHIVPQESFLFSDTLAANLRLSKPDATDRELLDALDIANARDVINRLEHGLETRIGDRGLTLSGGQRQRICLARALLGDASILGLDDATSALDASTEKTILDNIRNFKNSHGRTVTVVIVSSKLSTVLLADRVIVLTHGQIIAQGTHTELSKNNPAYRELMGIQDGN